MKIVINTCYGGFSLSDLAVQTLFEEGWKELGTQPETKKRFDWCAYSKDNKFFLNNRPEARDDPRLVEIVERLGEKANGMCAKLKIVEIPGEVSWYIEEYDGKERITQNHKTWN